MPLTEESLTKLKPSTRRVYSYLKGCRGHGAPLHVLQGPDIGGTAAGTRLSELGRFLRVHSSDEVLDWYYVDGADGKKTHSTVYVIRVRQPDPPPAPSPAAENRELQTEFALA